MSEKIIVLNGSPGKNGNPSALVAAFTAGAQSAGNSVTELHFGNMDIHGCKGCMEVAKIHIIPVYSQMI